MKLTTLWTDSDPSNNPQGTSRYSMNANLNKEKASVSNEGSFSLLSNFGSDKILIGKIPLDGGRFCLFSVVNNFSYTSEIGILTPDGSYQVVLRDNTLGNISLNFSTQHLIEGTFKILYNGDTAVYFTDNNNEPRYLNITNPQVAYDSSRFMTDAAELTLLNIFAQRYDSSVDLTAVEEGGSLLSGVYYVSVAYVDKSGNTTDYGKINGQISITDKTIRIPSYEYNGAPDGTPTSKSIVVTVPSSQLDRRYDYLKLAVIYKTQGTYKTYEYNTYAVPETGDLVIPIVSLDGAVELALDEVITPQARYTTAKTINQLDDVLYMANLKGAVDPGLQPFVNGIKTDYVTIEDTTNFFTGAGFTNELNIFFKKPFMWDETYALFCTFTLKDGTETVAYHIPGRAAVNLQLGTWIGSERANISTITDTNYYNGGGSSDLSPGGQIYRVSNTARAYHAFNTANNPNASTNMGYWENMNETYPDTSDWDIKDQNNTVIGTLRNTNIKHHKFPHPQDATLKMHTEQGSGQDYEKFNILGVKLSNIKLPADILATVESINVYYAKRDLSNRTILGQSLTLSASGLHAKQGDTYSTNHILNGVGNIQFWDIFTEASELNQPQYQMALTPSTLFNNRTAIPTYNQNNSSYANYNTTPFNANNDYYTFQAFDLLANDTSIASATYVKNLFKIRSKYVFNMQDGDASANPDGGTDHPVNYTLGLTLAPSSSNYFGIQTPALSNKIRKLRTKNYIPANYPGSSTLPATNPFGTTMIPYNYGGEKNILLEYENKIDPSGTIGAPGQEFAVIEMKESGSLDTIKPSINATGFASPYLANLCVYKEDIYYDFSNMELAYTGYSFKLSSNAATIGDFTPNIYGGDTYINKYGFRSSVDLGRLVGDAGGNRTLFSMKAIHYFICQSNANINFRHEGEGTYEKYYPKTTSTTINGFPATQTNSFLYNSAYSSVNDIKQPAIIEKVKRAETDSFPTRVIRSGKNNPESLIDNFRSFLANDYIELNKNKGEIEVLKVFNNKLVIHFTNNINLTLGREVLKTGTAESFIGSGDIFAITPKDIVYTETGYGGTQAQWAGVVTPFGYFYPDQSTGKVFLAGEGLIEISNIGMFNFFRDNLKSTFSESIERLIKQKAIPYVAGSYQLGAVVLLNNIIYRALVNTSAFPENSEQWEELYDLSKPVFTLTDNPVDIQGVGLAGTFDYTYNRYLLAKKDFKLTTAFGTNFVGVYGKNVPFTNGQIAIFNNRLYYISTILTFGAEELVAYDTFTVYGTPVNLSTAAGTLPNHFTISYYPEEKGWGSWYTFYPELLLSHNTKLLSSKNSKLYQHNRTDDYGRFYDTQTYHPFIIEPVLKGDPVVKRLSSFQMETKALAQDTAGTDPTLLDKEVYLKTFDDYFVYDSYQMSDPKSIINTKTARNTEGYWSINDFRDKTLDNSALLFTTNGYLREQNTANLDANKHWSKQKRFVDYWFIPRLRFLNQHSQGLTGFASTSTTRITGTVDTALIKVGDTVYVEQSGVGKYVLVTAVTATYFDIDTAITSAYTFTSSELKKMIPINLNFLNIFAKTERNSR